MINCKNTKKCKKNYISQNYRYIISYISYNKNKYLQF